jgi:glucose dehydrogenase
VRRTLTVVLLTATAIAQVTYDDLRKADPRNWLSYSGSYHAQRHSLLNQIHTGTVGDLVARWVYHIPGASRRESVPVVVDGVMYISQPNEV